MIAACIKWVDRRPEVDPLTGAVRTDLRTAGPSDADDAAVEWALRVADASGDEVLAVTAGPPSADAVLHAALAAGAAHANATTSSRPSARALCRRRSSIHAQ